MDSARRRVTDEEVLKVVRSNLPGVRNADRIDVHSDLWAAGMDSLANIAVMVAVEDAFGIEFADETLTPETFTSVSTIAEAVRSLQPAAYLGGDVPEALESGTRGARES